MSVLKKITGLFLLTFIISLYSHAEISRRLTDNWSFVRTDLGGVWEAVRMGSTVNLTLPEAFPLWENVVLPHCYNAFDAVDPDVNYYQGPAWYKTQIEVKNPYQNGHTLIHFEGAGQKTDVYVYTTKVGSHVGGYDEWTVDITDAVSKFFQNESIAKLYNYKVPISIRCDNSRDLEMIPSNLSDFNLYGGLYRNVSLIYKPEVYVSDIQINSRVDLSSKNGVVDLGIKTNKSLFGQIIKYQIINPFNEMVFDNELLNKDTVGNVELIIPNAHLWSTQKPQLYTCKLILTNGNETDTITKHFGFRNFEFKDKGPFFLNGERLLLRGTHRHEDHAGVGAAMTDAQIREEMNLIKDMGANFIRLGHYQQSALVLDLCDSLGILVWEEIPWCRGGLGGVVYQQMAKRMLTNMINQHRNHPSIILWGLGNENDWEGDFPVYEKDSIRKFMGELNVLAQQLDNSRKTSIRRCDFCKDIIDVYSPSIWAGWYRGLYSEYKTETEKSIQAVNHFFHAEWGGDSHAGRHSNIPDKSLLLIQRGGGVDEKLGDALLSGGKPRVSKDGDWSETYICDLFDWHLKEQETMPDLTGSAFWVFKDFSTSIRPDNPIPYVNQKGVVERDFTKKESYFVFQSYWAEKPLVHIYGHSWPIRAGYQKGMPEQVKVYSNCEQVELFMNGKSMGVKKRNSQDFPAAGLRWNVRYKSGKNTLKAVGLKNGVTVTDDIVQQYQTKVWKNPERLELHVVEQQNDTAIVQVYATDINKTKCLDAKNLIEFECIGDGHLIDNLGTSSGSRKIQLANGQAHIKVKLNKGKSIVTVKSKDMNTESIHL